MNSLKVLLNAAGEAANVAAASLSGTASVVASVVAASLLLAADIAESGRDPVSTLSKMRDAKPWLEEQDDRWSKTIDERFGP